jgi:dTDP-4-dehydrorhamnose 3,5-epimerase
MIFNPTPLRNAYTIDWEPRSDERGLFARTFCAEEFGRHGLVSAFVQANISDNRLTGTVRGMHFQKPPHAEVKLVRCVRGAIFDVIIDIRPESPTYRMWFGTILSAENGTMMYVPEGFAHGYQTLADDSTAFYLVSEPYTPHAETGVRYDDPIIGVTWPLPTTNVSSKDSDWPLLDSNRKSASSNRRCQ